MNDLLIIFAKNAKMGLVKTRLAATVGSEKALHVYNDLIAHTQSLIPDKIATSVYHFPENLESFHWIGEQVSNKLQAEGDLGDKMKSAILDGFKAGFDRVVLIGTDCFELKESHLELAFASLKTKPVVFGPAKDGGYYLVGAQSKMQNKLDLLFRNIPWSTKEVLKKSIQVLDENKLDYALLEVLSDVDVEEDLPEWYQL